MKKIENPFITIYTNSNIYGTGIIFYITKNNVLIIDISSIKKSLSCNLTEYVLLVRPYGRFCLYLKVY